MRLALPPVAKLESHEIRELVPMEIHLQTWQHITVRVIQLFRQVPRRTQTAEKGLHARQIISDRLIIPLRAAQNFIPQRVLKIRIATQPRTDPRSASPNAENDTRTARYLTGKMANIEKDRHRQRETTHALPRFESERPPPHYPVRPSILNSIFVAR